MNRRDFLAGLSATGLALPGAAQLSWKTMAADAQSGPAPTQLQNDFFAVGFDSASGRLTIFRTSGDRLLSGAVSRAVTGNGDRATNQGWYRHAIEPRSFRDELGEGRQLVVRSADSEGLLDLELRISLYEGRAVIIVEMVCRNISPKPITLRSLEPLRAVSEEGGALHWAKARKILTNGPMYYDPGVVADFAALDTGVRRSWWNVGLFRGYQSEGLVFGALENQEALGQVETRRAGGEEIGLIAESLLAVGFVLRPGQAARSNRFMLNIGPDPYAALEQYAETMGKLQSARTFSVLNGWCDWFFAFEHVTEDEVVRNAEFAARVLKPYGLEYIQIDEGFQRWHGDWEGNSKFPHGMKWLANRIHRLGLKPGLWLAPYVVSEPCDVFQRHQDWLLRHPDGKLKRVGPWPSENSDWARGENPKRYGLDITHPEAAQWLFSLFETVGKRWGYEMIKIDFVDWSLLSAHQYYDAGMSRAAVYRKGFEIMRRAVGENCHLQDCGPGPVTVGLLDSMRIELDQNYGYRRDAWKQYFLTSTSSASAAAKRYYFHRRTWVNDADHVCLNLLSLTQAQAAATLLALTGGNLLSGDRLPDLDATRLEILRKVLPSSGQAARPVDLFDTDLHRVFALRIQRPFGSWTVLGVFNSSESDFARHALPLERLWLDAAKTYLAYDFWQERFYGEVQRELQVEVPPASVMLLALHEKRGEPQVLSTDRHVLQGALELERVHWDPETQVLQGVSLGPANTAHNLAVYVPESQKWVQGGPFLFHDFPDYSLKMMEEHILRVHVRLPGASRVEWKIDFQEFFKR